jgi:glucose/arabinose dehydrogenase
MPPRTLTTRRMAAAAAPLAAALALAACTPDTTERPPTTTSPAPAASAEPDTAPLSVTGDPTVVVAGLAAPWSVAFFGDTALVSARDSGEIHEVVDGGTRLVGTVAGVVHRGESGLLGLAVDGEGRLYAASTGSDGNRIQRFALEGEAGALRLGASETLVEGIPAGATHNGGRLAFGPDGMLYATTGDAGTRELARDRSSLAGKILRMTPDGAVPADNPFDDSLVYSLGHRNPQGIAWAPDGTMLAAEFGQNTWDELNVIEPGADYGWPDVEGIARDPAFVDPVQQWRPDEASPSGIVVVGGSVYIANLRGRSVRAVPLDDLGASEVRWPGEYGRIRDVAAAPDGTLWFVTNNTDGRGEPGADDDRVLSVPLG